MRQDVRELNVMYLIEQEVGHETVAKPGQSLLFNLGNFPSEKVTIEWLS